MTFEPFQQRVVDEHKELAEKTARLTAFTEGPMFKTLHFPEQARLHRQLFVMELYLDILQQRINAFTASSVAV